MGPAYSPPSAAVLTASVRAVGQLKSKIESLNRIANLISDDMAGFSSEIDRLSGCTPCDPSKSTPERPVSCDLESFQEQIDRLDRLAQFTRGQLDRLRAI